MWVIVPFSEAAIPIAPHQWTVPWSPNQRDCGKNEWCGLLPTRARKVGGNETLLPINSHGGHLHANPWIGQ